ncbi:MAG TPA: YwiC-like family protein [Terriglobales bacterium]|nr:YwiC-like family protein [Terriglobales bacterium]
MKKSMSEQSSPLAVSHNRLRALVVPREHGAWGMLLVPLASGATVGLIRGGQSLRLGFFTAAALAVFWLRTPLESWLGTSPLRAQTAVERRLVLCYALLLSTFAAFMFAGLFWDGRSRDLLPLGAIAAFAFAAQAFLKKLSRGLRMTAQVCGAIGLTAAAPAAYCVVNGNFDATAAALWLANWLFAGDQIHFVQLRIHAARPQTIRERLRRGRAFLAGQTTLAAVLILAAKFTFLPWPALLAFVPVLARGMAWFIRPAQPLAVRRLGWSELAHSLAFGMLLIAAFRF